MTCAACGHQPTDPTDAFCARCGAALQGESAAQPWTQLARSQRANTGYLKALFLLVLAGVVASIAATAALDVQRRDLTICITKRVLCDDPAPTYIIAAGGVVALLIVLIAVRAAARANDLDHA
jgi:hypothetical protein